MSGRIGLRILFALAARAPTMLRRLRPVVVAAAPLFVGSATSMNARRIFEQDLSRAAARQFARGVAAQFFDFILDVAILSGASTEAIRARVIGVEGEAAFRRARKSGRGAILVTAHMGSFEVGLAALRTVEAHVNVVFKRDEYSRFEQMRSDCRRRLGVVETPIDDGWSNLLRLRDALERDEVVVMQADRAFSGQRSQDLPVLGGRLRLPVGPVTLARLLGSAVVPVFVIREGASRDSGFRVHLLEPIDVSDPEEAMKQIAAAIGTFIRRYPEQWLVLTPAFVEDQPSAG